MAHNSNVLGICGTKHHLVFTLHAVHESRMWVTLRSFAVGGWCQACSIRVRLSGADFKRPEMYKLLLAVIKTHKNRANNTYSLNFCILFHYCMYITASKCVYITCLSKVPSILPQLLQQIGYHHPTLKLPLSCPHATFIFCMQSDITMVLFGLALQPKKIHDFTWTSLVLQTG